MADKKYYWLKLKRNFFNRHDIRVVENLPNGKDYVLFYLKLLVESIDHEGELRFADTIPYNEEMLSSVTNTNVDIVRTAIKVFQQLEMIDVLDDGTIYMNEVQSLIGSETAWAEKKRIYRGQKEDNVLALSDKSKSIEKEIDIDIKEIYKEKPKKVEKHKYGEYQNVLLTDDELEKLKNSFPDYEERIKELDEGIELKGYKYKSHYLAILKWGKNRKPKERKVETSYDIETVRARAQRPIEYKRK